MLRYKSKTIPGLVAFGLVRHPARKRSGSILTTPEPARGYQVVDYFDSS